VADRGVVVARSIIGWLIGALWLREASSGGRSGRCGCEKHHPVADRGVVVARSSILSRVVSHLLMYFHHPNFVFSKCKTPLRGNLQYEDGVYQFIIMDSNVYTERDVKMMNHRVFSNFGKCLLPCEFTSNHCGIQGVFIRQDAPFGSVICEYTGELLLKVMNTPLPQYAVELCDIACNTLFLCAQNSNSIMRFLRHDFLKRNCELRVVNTPTGLKAYITTTMFVAAGQELLLDYGPNIKSQLSCCGGAMVGGGKKQKVRVLSCGKMVGETAVCEQLNQLCSSAGGGMKMAEK